MATRNQILEFSWVRNFISIFLVVDAVAGVAHIILNRDSKFDYDPWLTVSAIQPLVRIVLPGIWLIAFWVVRTGGTNADDQ